MQDILHLPFLAQAKAKIGELEMPCTLSTNTTATRASQECLVYRARWQALSQTEPKALANTYCYAYTSRSLLFSLKKVSSPLRFD